MTRAATILQVRCKGSSAISLSDGLSKRSRPRIKRPVSAEWGITSTDSPGKIVKCGCFSNAWRRLHANPRHEGSHIVACVCDVVLSDLFRLAQRSAQADDCSRCFSFHDFQAAIPSCFFACRFSSVSSFHSVMPVLLPRKTTRYVLFVLMRSPFLCALSVETRVRRSDASAHTGR